MNRRALYYALAYSALVICFKLFILLKGYSFTTFGFYGATTVAAFLVIPFYILALKSVRDKEMNGYIGGREALRITLTVFAVSAIIISIYNYAEFQLAGKSLAETYYKSDQFLEFLKKQPKVNPERYGQIIQQQIEDNKGAAFKATTGKLFSFMIVGLGFAFITAVLMKRRAA